MTSKTVAQLLVDLGVDRSHSRPHTSNDNPYSEAAFKTLKYCPAFPGRFDNVHAARRFCSKFFEYYNHQHYHSGIALLTPATVHNGAGMVNTLFNTTSGRIDIGDHTFTGHNVSILTGTHNSDFYMQQRKDDFPHSGRDVVVGRGVWLGSNAVILGPCTIGDHAVVAAGAVVLAGTTVPPGAVVGGVPARILRMIDLPSKSGQ